jgi:hypothetical protein
MNYKTTLIIPALLLASIAAFANVYGTFISGTVPVVHFQLQVASAKEKVTVSASGPIAPTDSATPITLVDSLNIQRNPGADRTDSLAMISSRWPFPPRGREF